MKNAYLVSLISCVFLSSCGVPKVEPKNPQTDIDISIQELLESFKAGGLPGEIALTGALVKTDGTLDQRVTFEQVIGTPSEKVKIPESKKAKLVAVANRAEDYKPSNFGSYLNVGCDLTDDTQIAGMTEMKNKPNEFGIVETFGAAASMVDKIFVCGKVQVRESFVILNANEIFLKDAQLLKENQFGTFALMTDKLTIDGKNLILTTGMNSDLPSILGTSDIRLTVYEELLGTGQLNVKSVGGNFEKKNDK